MLQYGDIVWCGVLLVVLKGEVIGVFCCDIQLVFQDVFSVVNLCKMVCEIVSELLCYLLCLLCEVCVWWVEEMLLVVDFVLLLFDKCLVQFSGGQLQCVCLVCVLVVWLQLLIFDEVVLNFDLLLQVEIIVLLKCLQVQFDIVCLFIIYDLWLVECFCQ